MNVKLLMLSGGYDSTCALVKALTETNDDVWVHHIVLKNKERRNEAETLAVKNIVEYCRKNYRPFKFSSSEFSYYDNNFFGWDVLTVGYISTIVSTSIQDKYFVMYGEYPTVETIYAIPKDDTDWLEDRKPRLEALLNANYMFYEKHSIPIPTISYYISDMTKQEIINYLPPALKHLCWSCRTPQKVGDDFVECGNCVSCQMIKEQTDG